MSHNIVAMAFRITGAQALKKPATITRVMKTARSSCQAIDKAYRMGSVIIE